MAITKVKSSSIEDLDSTKLTGTIATARLSNVDLTTLSATNLTSGSIADARVPASAVTQHVPAVDLTTVRQDISMLAMYNSVSDNRAAYNLPHSFIDTFQDDTGLTTQTDVDRNASGEYISSISDATVDANVSFLGHMDSASLVDSSSSPLTTTINSPATYSTTQKKFGTGAYYGNSAVTAILRVADSSMYNTGTGDFTWEAWIRTANTSLANQQIISFYNAGTGNDSNSYLKIDGGNLKFYLNGVGLTSTFSVSADTWYHVAAERTSATAMHVYMGAAGGTNTITTGSGGASYNLTTDYMAIGNHHGVDGNQPFHGYIDEVRISNVARYGGSAFTPSTSAFYSEVVSATGTLISDTQTAPVATTKMSGVILYKDNAGTATLGTDLKIYLSANGGTNYTEAASYGTVTPLFSAGVKMVRLGETTVTSGTTPVIKAVWANQASGSKDTQLHGWAMNY